MIKNINNLVKFDFTPYCRECQYRKDYGMLEYCCSFVIDLLEQEHLNNLKKNIIEYILEDKLSKIDKDNVFFEKDTMWGISLTFKTNLREDETLILHELRKAILNSPFFNDLILDGTLYKLEHDENIDTFPTVEGVVL